MNGSTDLLSKSMDRFLYDKDLRHERVKTREDAFVKIKMHVKKYRNLKWTLSHLLSHYVSVLFAYCNVIPFYNLFDTKIFYCLRGKGYFSYAIIPISKIFFWFCKICIAHSVCLKALLLIVFIPLLFRLVQLISLLLLF